MTDMPLHDEERHVWRGHPSQLLNLPTFALLTVAAAGATWLLFVGRGPMMRGVSVETGGAAIRAFPWVVASVWIIAALVALAVALRTASTKYELTTERLRVTDGLLSTTTEELELRRVRDDAVRASIPNTGQYRDRVRQEDIGSEASHGITYRVCNAGTPARCSQAVVVQY